MKTRYNLFVGIGLFILGSILLIACVNHISEEDEATTDDGNIPLKFIANIHELSNTRVTNNKFEVGDEVGLFAACRFYHDARKNVMWIIFILFVLPEMNFHRMSRSFIRMMA